MRNVDQLRLHTTKHIVIVIKRLIFLLISELEICLGRMGKSKRAGGTIGSIYSETLRPLANRQLPFYRDVDLALEDAKLHIQMKPEEAVKKVSDEVIVLYPPFQQ